MLLSVTRHKTVLTRASAERERRSPAPWGRPGSLKIAKGNPWPHTPKGGQTRVCVSAPFLGLTIFVVIDGTENRHDHAKRNTHHIRRNNSGQKSRRAKRTAQNGKSRQQPESIKTRSTGHRSCTRCKQKRGMTHHTSHPQGSTRNSLYRNFFIFNLPNRLKPQNPFILLHLHCALKRTKTNQIAPKRTRHFDRKTATNYAAKTP